VGLKLSHTVHGLVCTTEIQDIRTPKGITKRCHINTSTFAFQSIFQSLSKKKALCNHAIPVSEQKHWEKLSYKSLHSPSKLGADCYQAVSESRGSWCRHQGEGQAPAAGLSSPSAGDADPHLSTED